MKSEEFNKELGKYFLDISKLIFGGIVIASVIEIENVSKYGLLLIGILITGIFATVGFRILKRK
ncbi:MAG: ABC transporter permease [Bacteroidetes bacterium]|nr:ABC transporter permease [Bacteroidota bacterium]HNR18426.1 ABC transporter permease [Bacteroidia bacterium]HNU32255.1 ABC transporter permease [Bacteroidia bacterium]